MVIAQKSKISREFLIQAFREAADAAVAADPGADADGETCNFDRLAVKLPGIRVKTVMECATIAEISVDEFIWFGRQWFCIHVPSHGQANRRTVMAQAACRKLQDFGLKSLLYYQMD